MATAPLRTQDQEIALGATLAAAPEHRRQLTGNAAAFFTAIVPGNISQYTQHRDAFGLDTATHPT